MTVQVYNYNMQESEAQVMPGLQSEIKVSMGTLAAMSQKVKRRLHI